MRNPSLVHIEALLSISELSEEIMKLATHRGRCCTPSRQNSFVKRLNHNNITFKSIKICSIYEYKQHIIMPCFYLSNSDPRRVASYRLPMTGGTIILLSQRVTEKPLSDCIVLKRTNVLPSDFLISKGEEPCPLGCHWI